MTITKVTKKMLSYFVRESSLKWQREIIFTILPSHQTAGLNKTNKLIQPTIKEQQPKTIALQALIKKPTIPKGRIATLYISQTI